MYDKVKMKTKAELDVINSAYFQAKIALESIAKSDLRTDEAMKKSKGEILTREGIELAIADHEGLEPFRPVLHTNEYRPKSSLFLLQLIDDESGDLIVQAEHNCLASALFDLRENAPFEKVRCILWVYRPGAGYLDVFDSVHAESIGHDHIHINDEGDGAWITSEFIEDPENPMNSTMSHRVYGMNLKAYVNREENEKDGHYVSLELADVYYGINPKRLFEVVVMLTPTEDEDMMI